MVGGKVFPDSTNSKLSGVIGLAAPKDRLAAYVLDCAILLPLVQLLQAPIRRNLFEAMLFEESQKISQLQFFNLLIFIVLFIVYYTVCTWWKGQTLGKLFFGVKVISYQGKLSFFQSLQRSVTIFFEFLSLGYPFLAIFSHNLRRPIHDRVADTLVISLKSPIGFPTRSEKFGARLVGTFMSFLFVGFSLAYIIEDDDFSHAEFLSLETDSCEHYVATSAGDAEVLTSHYIARTIESECLFEEARDLLWDNADNQAAKLALALVHRDDDEKSRSYLEAMCDGNEGEYCQFSKWMLANLDQEKASADQLFNLVKGEVQSPLLKALVGHYLLKEQSFFKLSKILGSLNQPHPMEPAIASMQFQALLGQLKWDEALWVYRAHGSVNDKDLVDFLNRDLEVGVLTTKQHIQLLELFYPELQTGSYGGRFPASTSSAPEEIIELYEALEGEL